MELTILVSPHQMSLACLLLQAHSVKPQRYREHPKQIHRWWTRRKRVVCLRTVRELQKRHIEVRKQISQVCTKDCWTLILLYCQINYITFRIVSWSTSHLLYSDLHRYILSVLHWYFSNFCRGTRYSLLNEVSDNFSYSDTTFYKTCADTIYCRRACK
jgi:hypothetical protein